MRFLNFYSTDEIDDILDRFSFYFAKERHNIFTSWFTPYHDYRNGIHTYIKNNWVWGYYETGERGTQNMLHTSKNWFYMKLSKKISKTHAKGIIVEDIFLLPALFVTTLIQVLSFIYFGNSDNLNIAVITLIFALIFLKPTYENNKKLYDEIKSVLTQGDGSTKTGDGSMIDQFPPN